MPDELPRILRAFAALDGEHLALALVAASGHPEWVDKIVWDAPPEALRDALRYLAVDVVGSVLSSPTTEIQESA
jgi:hypothetical protein